MQIKKVCVLGSRGLVAFDLDGPAGHYCSWEQRCHRSNFSLLKADFWYGTFAHQCWDPQCKRKYQHLWNAHTHRLPDALQQCNHLFEDPEEFDPHLEEFMAASDGQHETITPAGLHKKANSETGHSYHVESACTTASDSVAESVASSLPVALT
jgi:hypothetical protein